MALVIAVLIGLLNVMPHARTPRRIAQVNCDSAFLARPHQATASNTPELQNPEQALAAVRATYRERVKNGARGTVQVWIAVGKTGKVEQTLIGRSSGSIDVDSIGLLAAAKFRFVPAAYQGRPVCFWLQMPLTLPPRSD